MQETIGQRLKQIRLSRQLTLEKAAEATRVRAHYLEALEADNYSAMSSAAQGRGFLRLYADFLGLDLETAMNELRQGEPVDAQPETPALVVPTPALIPAPQTPPASSSDGKTVRRPFWSRLLRRGDSQTAPAEEPVVEAAPAAVEETAPAPLILSAEEPALDENAAPKKKTRVASKTSRPKTDKPKTAAKKTDKKKVSLKSNLTG